MHMPVDVRSVSLTIIAGAAILGVLKLAQPVIIPFVVSGLLFYALDPAVDWLQRWKRAARPRRRADPAARHRRASAPAATRCRDDVMSVVERAAARRAQAARGTAPALGAADQRSTRCRQTARAIDQAAAEATGVGGDARRA